MRQKSIESALENANPIVAEYFLSTELADALKENVAYGDIVSMIDNSSKFDEIIQKELNKRWDEDLTGLFGEETYIPETKISGGRTREAETGYRINTEYLGTIGIDPSKVLFFRVTQPSETPKPESYWTSDYFETIKGLRREISPEKRENSIVLVTSLETINQNQGLIQDINDDSGLAVRQIGTGPFEQSKAITYIKPDYEAVLGSFGDCFGE